MLKGSIMFAGKTQRDIEQAIQNALARIERGAKYGFDVNADKEQDQYYSFKVTGKEED